MKNNTKKKIVSGVVIISAFALTGLQTAGANPWGGGPGCDQCDNSGYWYQQQMDEKSTEARDAFLKETSDLRKEYQVKRAEKRAIMLNDNPDPKRVSELTGELFDLREQLQKKAQEKGLRNIGFDRRPWRGCGGPEPKRFRGRF